MFNQHFFATSTVLTSLLASQCAWAGMVSDAHGNIGYETAAECDAAVRAGNAKFYKTYTHKSPLLRSGEARVQVMNLKDLAIPQDIAKSMSYPTQEYKLGACDVGAARKAGRDGVAKPLQGMYIPYSPDMPVNVYLNKMGQPVRTSMKECDNWFGAAFPRPVPSVPVATSSAEVVPVVVDTPAVHPMVQVPLTPASVISAMEAAQGHAGLKQFLGTVGLIAIGAVVANNNDNGATGTTGTTGTN